MNSPNMLEYKGYHTLIEYSAADRVLHGKIECINDLVDFESDDIGTIEEEFHRAVDDYLAFCEETGKEPDKEYSGTFNVRVSPELHRRLAAKASKQGKTLNKLAQEALQSYCDNHPPINVSITYDMRSLAQISSGGQAATSTDSQFSYRAGSTARAS